MASPPSRAVALAGFHHAPVKSLATLAMKSFVKSMLVSAAAWDTIYRFDAPRQERLMRLMREELGRQGSISSLFLSLPQRLPYVDLWTGFRQEFLLLRGAAPPGHVDSTAPSLMEQFRNKFSYIENENDFNDPDIIMLPNSTVWFLNRRISTHLLLYRVMAVFGALPASQAPQRAAPGRLNWEVQLDYKDGMSWVIFTESNGLLKAHCQGSDAARVDIEALIDFLTVVQFPDA
ncbi:hypothetical protein BT63DRAFT_453284 [Microthyrium microscopicum]|uniref:Uncharacterized protein n=1 Tax=Microthyrium microscopicum TaxID=703497 RepID=A0A6A6UJ51_9PEZI|nr:hypothetical protein BT63DRAFT_453284 [Microthyrium microscopicum]